MTPEEVLEEAAKWLAEHDWCQNVLTMSTHKEVTHACAMGAIEQVNELYVEAIDLLTAYLASQCTSAHPETYIHPVAWWNDRPERTVEDVILAMKCAARNEGL